MANLTGRNISKCRDDNYEARDEKTSRKKKRKKARAQNKTYLLTLRTESNLQALAFEVLCDLACHNLFSLVPHHPCLTSTVQSKVPGEALLLPSMCWGCPFPTHSSRLRSGATSSRKPSDSSGFLNHPVLSPVTVLIALCCPSTSASPRPVNSLRTGTRYDPFCVPRAQPKARHQ